LKTLQKIELEFSNFKYREELTRVNSVDSTVKSRL